MIPTAPDSAWWATLRARADAAPALPRDPLWLEWRGGSCAGAGAGATAAVRRLQIGSIEPALAAALIADGLLHAAGGSSGCVLGEANAQAPADAALARIARWLQAHGLGSAWRDELLDVPDAEGTVRARIERAAVRPLGIATRAVHLVGRTPDRAHWVQQRALDKATDPGAWDTLMSGQVAAGESDAQTLARETWEEAGLRIGELLDVRAVAPLVVRRPVADGYLVEHIEVFTATVPDALRPENRDGEVAQFERLDRAALLHRLMQGAFTLDASLILAAALAGS